MQYAIVKLGATPVYASLGAAALSDEVLFGMAVEVNSEEENGFVYIVTPWGFAGYVRRTDLFCNEKGAKEWMAYGKMAARSPFVDVMQRPAVDSTRLACLPRGGLVHPLGAQDEEGWLPVGLPGGVRGYAKGGNLMHHMAAVVGQEESILREALATSALSYLGTQFRWGGRTPLGIDSVGLVSMAYLLNGALLPRSTQFAEDASFYQIEAAALKMGDVIYFKGHVAMYLGEGQFVHATSKNGSDAVVLNSLEPTSPFYLPELAESIVACASLFS